MPPRGETAQRLLDLLRDGPCQAHELADELAIDTSAARRHLETLRAAGLVTAREQAEGVGRPKLRYALTLEGRETFHREYALLLAATLKKIQETHGRDAMLTLMRSLARDLAAPAAAAPNPTRALVKLYNDLGFEARLEGGAIVQRNCVALRTAIDDPEALCNCFDEEIIRTALPGARVELTECMATGDARCVHQIHAPTP